MASLASRAGEWLNARFPLDTELLRAAGSEPIPGASPSLVVVYRGNAGLPIHRSGHHRHPAYVLLRSEPRVRV